MNGSNPMTIHPLIADVRRLTDDLRLWELAVIIAGLIGLIIGALLVA